LVHVVNENVRMISFIILIPSVLLFFIAVALINNTIRLSVYSKRFLIRTMQLVGASSKFIRRPFLARSALHGIYSGLVSILMMVGLLYLAQNALYGIVSFEDFQVLGILFGSILLIGMVISMISTYFAVRKYLKMKEDYLYY
jgi:cell division transport system permease protein